MRTLAPRWGDSYEEMEAFRDDCKHANLPPEHVRTYESIIVLVLAKSGAPPRKSTKGSAVTWRS